MDTNIYETDEKSQRRRIIVIATLILLVVLSIAAWAIAAIASSDQNLKTTAGKTEADTNNGASNSTIAIEESGKEAPASEGVSTEAKTEAKTETEAKAETVASTETAAKAETTTNTETTAATETEAEIPATRSSADKKQTSSKTTTPEATPEAGPEELLPLALVAGLAATYFASLRLAKRA